MTATVLKVDKHKSQLKDKGDFWYIFWKGDDGVSYKTCVYEKFRNFARWGNVIRKGAGTRVENLLARGKMIDADSFPRIVQEVGNGQERVQE